MLLLLLNYVLWKIDVYPISTLVDKSLYYYYYFRQYLTFSIQWWWPIQPMPQSRRPLSS